MKKLFLSAIIFASCSSNAVKDVNKVDSTLNVVTKDITAIDSIAQKSKVAQDSVASKIIKAVNKK